MKFLAALSVAMVMWVHGLAQEAKPGAQAPWRSTPVPPAQIGRYVAIQPPQNPGPGSYTNFIWVLDTATGAIVAYRIANFTDENGKNIGFMTERLESAYDYYLRTSSQKK